MFTICGAGFYVGLLFVNVNQAFFSVQVAVFFECLSGVCRV